MRYQLRGITRINSKLSGERIQLTIPGSDVGVEVISK